MNSLLRRLGIVNQKVEVAKCGGGKKFEGYFIRLGAAIGSWDEDAGYVYNNYAKGKKRGWILKIATKKASIRRELGLDRGWALEKVSKHGQRTT